MTDYIKTFKCPNCGILASGRGHLCHPIKETGAYTCESCKKKTEDPRHACKEMVNALEYICKKCGRLAVYDSLLCEPELISQD